MSTHTAESLMLLRRRMGLDQDAFGRLIGVTRAYVSRLENGHFEISAQIAEKLRELEQKGDSTNVLRESAQAAYGARIASVGSKPGATEPTDEQILDYFMASLAVAREVPGGRGYVWAQLKMNLSPEQIRRLED